MVYKIHPTDAVVLNVEKNTKIVLSQNVCTTSSELRVEAELIQGLLNWYSCIDMELLDTQINDLCVVLGQLDMESNLRSSADGIVEALGALILVKDDIKTISNNKVKDDVEKQLINLYTKKMGIDIPENHEDITQYVYEYILDVVGVGNYSDQDIAIGFRQWIENK
jgi:hypothetical protein